MDDNQNIIQLLKNNGVDLTQKMTEYKYKVCKALLKERNNIDVSYEEIVNVIDEYKKTENNNNDKNENDKSSVTDMSGIDELDEINKIIDEDDDIPESDWKLFLKWKHDDAIWSTDKDGAKKSIADCFENIVGFIKHFPKTKDKIKFNKIRNVIEFNGRQVVDSDYHKIINYINKYFLPKFSKLRIIKDAVDNVGFNNEFNPWIEYFDSLEYVDDGIDYIEYTIKNVLCCEEQETYYDLYYETLKIMFLAVMCRIYNKERGIATKFDTVTTICGENGGSGKTTFYERLFDLDGKGDSYCYVVAGDSFKPNDKDFIERSHQCVCLFLDELTMRRAIVTSIKGYITQRDDRFRKAYGFNNEPHKRGFIITASSNNIDILKDYTTDTERRWAIIKISEDVKNYINVNNAFDNGYRDKIWAFIKKIYIDENRNPKLYIEDSRLEALQKQIQRDYKASNNADYNAIINDLLEREYGFYDENIVDVDLIVSQYRSGDSMTWCKMHNDEIYTKQSRAREDKYIMRPEDRFVKYYGKINRISKKTLFDILDKLKFEYTKVTLNAEIRYNGKWNGWKRGNNACVINHCLINAYWRIESKDVIKFSYKQDSSCVEDDVFFLT